MGTLRIDSKGRLTLPKGLREELEIGPGDTIFFEREGSVLRLAKAANPFDALAAGAVAEWRAGQTTSLRAFSRSRRAELNGDK
jgi:AbrB family looped-hinge helix DNA binding protein